MYENEMKEGFCEDYLRSRIIQKTSLYGLFRKIEPYEKEFKKDISEFTKQEALSMYKSMKSRSVYSLMNNNTVLKAYCAWREHYHNAKRNDAYVNITIEDLKPCVNKNANKVLSIDEITEIEDQVLNATDAAIIQCLFEGISGPSMRDITDLHENMLDKSNKCIIFPDGRLFDISDRLCYLLEKAFEEDIYVCYGETFRTKKLNGKGKLIKDRDNVHGADSDDKRFRMIYRKIMIIRDYVGIKELTMKGIAASGFVYYLKKGLDETNLGLKEYLQSKDGEHLMDRYNYKGEFRIDNVIHRVRNLI